MVLLEAMAKHVPVVTTAEPYNNMASLLQDRSDAVLLPSPDDVTGMAAALSQINSDPAFRKKLALQGFAFAQQYSWDVAKAKYYQVYRKVTNRAPR